MALTPRSTVGDWLDHPVGGPILTAFLAQGTGAASGIGRAVASRVAREGGRVIAADLSAERLDELAATITFLLSKDSVNLNGAIIAADGGRSAV